MFGWRTGRTYVRRYSRSSNSEEKNKVLEYILFFIFIVVFYFWASNEHYEREMRFAFDEVKEEVVHSNGNHVNYYNEGKLVYFTTNEVIPSDVLIDQDFQLISPPNALKMKRVEEYCQWIEIQEHHTREDNQGNKVEYVTYHYTKEWVSSPIISVFYDQAFAHNNPQRQPFPSKYWQTETAQAGAYTLTSPIISSLKSFHTYELSPNELAPYMSSLAYTLEKFNYIGGGYFYSAYEERGTLLFARLFGQFIEGSLLDYQLVDLFPQCTAGDVRVHFEVATPNYISVVGKQVDEKGTIGLWRTSRDFELGYIHDGIFSVEEIFEKELSDHHWLVVIFRVVISLLIHFCACLYFDTSLFDSLLFAFSLSFISLFFALTFLILYPFSILSGIALVCGAAGIAFSFPSFHDDRKNN